MAHDRSAGSASGLGDAMTHDPRIYPKPGDVIRKGAVTRTVCAVPGYSSNDVWYWTKDPEVKRNCWITTWQDWAKKAEVLHVAAD